MQINVASRLVQLWLHPPLFTKHSLISEVKLWMYRRLDRQSLGIFRFEFEDDCEDENKLFFFLFSVFSKKYTPWKALLFCFFVCLFVVVVVVFFYQKNLHGYFNWRMLSPLPVARKMIKLLAVDYIFLFSAMATFSLKPVIMMRTTTTFSRQNDAGSRAQLGTLKVCL